ncbi:hypothetical protein ZPR_2663 [Zunongwangia profunda SM-A87]|uniref:Uncharacterized protein n=1 Tax=Zunongwangia profunda (strain DSM 18752 / CCTCC AB 206139 / SM-A87) TaxID=655815 RepID=D5BF87_ZUNPS|nr:hypothetical protein ZPR_2663 [Zunongwangia profunda SM-A87]
MGEGAKHKAVKLVKMPYFLHDLFVGCQIAIFIQKSDFFR